MKVMSVFAEFYVTLLGFINYRLYHTLNLIYPPKLALTGGEWTEEVRHSRCWDEPID